MKFKFLLLQIILLIFTGTFFSSSWAIDICETHEICASSTDCECIVPAESLYFRNYYFDFQNIQQGTLYECHLTSTPTEPFLLLNESTLPQGSKVTACTEGCPYFPLNLELDTHGMTEKTDTLILKYQVPPSDAPSHLTASCKIKN